MQRYLLLLHQNASPNPPLDPERMRAAIERYKAWGQRLHDEGKFVGSNKLENETGRILRTNGGGKVQVTDGPYVETKELIGGYYLIEAASYEEAVEQCRDHPHLTHGTIEIRRVDAV
jgi:hypothetical protein